MNYYCNKIKWLAISTLLCAAPTLLRAAEGAGEAAALGPKDYWTMGIKIFNFIILIVILVRFLAKPLADYLAARAEAIRTRLETLKEKQAAAVQAESAYAGKLQGIEEEIVRLKETARRDMDQEQEQVLSEARRVAEEIVQHAHETVQRELTKARADLHREATSLSLELAEGLITRHLDAQDQRRFAEEYIKDIGRPS